VAYSEGFSPRPKLSFGLALSVAHESDAEYLDVELISAPDIESLPAALSDALPDGLDVTAVIVLEPGTVSLQQAITSCTWRIEVLGAPPDMVSAAVADALSASELWLERVRKGKTSTVDVRPTILELSVEGPTDHGTQLVAELATESMSLRPSELVAVLGIEGLTEGRVRRTHQWTIVDGVRSEPVSPPNPSTRHEQELLRAS
jgi:radical SAM-linked protein